MSLRMFVCSVGVVLIAVAALLLLLPINVGDQVACGNALFPSWDRAASVDNFNEIAPYRRTTEYVAECRETASPRKTLGLTAAAIGLIALVGGAVVRTPTKSVAE